MTVAEANFVKQADHKLYNPRNKGTISECTPEKLKLVHHAHEEDHQIGWEEARTLQI